MTLNKLDPGAAPNNGLGTPLRTGAGYINAIITEMWDTVTGGISYIAGKVGIGVTPIYDLHVVADIATVACLIQNNDDAGFGQIIQAGLGSNYILNIKDKNGVSRFKFDADGTQFNPDTYNNTTASAANMLINSAGEMFRSTSSEKLKDVIGEITPEYSSKIFDIAKEACIFYKSLCKKDDKTLTHYGLSAEKLALIEPRLVHFGYWPEDYIFEEKEVINTKEIFNKKTKKIEVQEIKSIIKDRVLKVDAIKTPVGVQEGKITPLILKEMDRMNDKINDLEQKLLKLEK